MSLYTFALFVHVVGVICAFVGVGAWFFGWAYLRRAERVEHVRAVAELMTQMGTVAVVGVAFLLISGIYMVITTWGLQTPWIDVASVTFVLVGGLGGRAIEPQLRAVVTQARETSDGPVPPALDELIHSALPAMGLSLYVTLLLGIVLLMIAKPALGLSLLLIGVALVLGLVWGFFLVSRDRNRAGSRQVVHAAQPNSQQ